MTWTQTLQTAKKYLCPPGEGIHTLSAGGDSIKELQQLFYGRDLDKKERRSLWEGHLEKIRETDSPLLFGLCSDVGGGILKGAAWGPLYIRCEISDYINHPGFLDIGDVRVVPHLLHDKYLNTETLQRCRRSLYGDSSSSLPVSPLSIAEDFLRNLYELSPTKKAICHGRRSFV